MRIANNLIFIGLAVLVIALAACKNDGGDPPANPPTGLNLLDLDVTKSTGQSSITGTNITLTGEGAAGIIVTGGSIVDYISNVTTNGSFSVTNGKLSFDLGTPSSPSVVTSLNKSNSDSVDFFYRTDSDYKLTFSDSSATAVIIPGFVCSFAGSQYTIWRFAEAGDGVTYLQQAAIGYIYVSADCTISRQAKTWTEPGNDGSSWTVDYKAFELPLKTGWNLIQIDMDVSGGGETTVLKIADKDVPWTIEKYN
jgi:hypothetical protein